MRWLVIPIVLLAGCILDDDWSEVRLARIDFNGSGVDIDAPSSAAAGESFAVTVTVIDGGCTRFEKIDVESTRNDADVFPYQRITHGAGKCTSD